MPKLTALFIASLSFVSMHSLAAEDFQYYAVGNTEDVVTDTRGLIVMQGGGDDVDFNYQRMGEYSGGGDFVVLRASGGDDYNPYILDLCNCDSVETIVFENRDAAYDEFVIHKIKSAEALFIAGGDQSRYVRFWKGTPVEDAIHEVASKPAPVGGTSAGMAVLGQFTYSAMTESLTSAAALSDPFHKDVWLEADFLILSGMENIITDQHLIERDRIGRTITLMARLIQDGLTPTARAIAAERETAVHIDPASGNVEIFSTHDHETPYVYFMRSTQEAATCAAGEPLSIEGVKVYRASVGNSFNLKTWDGVGGIAYEFNVDDGVLHSSREDIY